MENALLVGLSRQMALTHELDVIANNIANIDTTGYKADNAMFEQYLMPRASDQTFSGPDRRVSFVEDRATWIDMSQGSIQHTGNPLDVAIAGTGYFVIQTPRGQQRYTRNGDFTVNASGQLVTSTGDQVIGDSGPITFQSTDHDVVISPTGIITVREGNSTAEFAARHPAARKLRATAAFAKGRQFDFHGAGRRCCRSGAGQHHHRAGLDREVECERRCGDGAADRSHAQLHRYRQRFATAER